MAVGLALSIGSLVAPIQAQAASGPKVQTNKGPVQGFIANGVAEFLGIPYAAPPVGDLRWRPPQPHEVWQKALDARNFGPICLQTASNPYSGPANMNEDCLFLNIFTPEIHTGTRQRLPVIVYIHGGGNSSGESTGYDGSKLAGQGHTVVVTLNYRLGLLGDMANPAIDAEGHPFGNYDILDQQAALRWVQKNIINFGGDPNNITLAGQSGGSADTEASVMSPLAKGLLQRAILESHVYEPTPLASAEAQGAAFAVAAGCGAGASPAVAACLRALPASKIFALDSGPYHSEIIGDGQVVPNASFRTLIQQGRFNHVPVMSGTTEDEETFSLAGTEYSENPRHPFTAADYQNMVNSYASASYPSGTAAKLQALYPLNAFVTPALAMDAIGTDPWACKQRGINSLLADKVPVYAYEFDDRTAPSYYPTMPGLQLLAYHTGDIQYLFPLYHGSPLGIVHELNRKQEKLSDEMVAAWTNFAWTGNPNGVGNSPWPRYKNRPSAASERAPAILSENIPALSTFTDHEFSQTHNCDFWDSVSPF
ncbi:carboxylesterase/lipase family protein [Methylocella silvestris]|uniref:carboxylesterase/lipase family protein n=1 Tax=Methylocella silvestris TaxID=199596 RepID=UPI001FCADB6D|nr:carboxylesterase family protein [Methylocella silvestris]